MFSNVFDRLITGLLLTGMAIGVGLCGLAWFLYWLASHIQVSWVWGG